ncbi:uncharacterized protein LOC111695692 isoform X3 [Eurytemora carolleeae]|uniref:uncharacterized protein LOC111695692 isoform X3 n=1 Tax=Eurytemora carolleeae TaxID=1294199 RepID=UPI000C76297E|nr:uncharacterized protein LOC111695692 isoform X3 [Eurytemora carolleeae]|eukprot:XP_023320868.1 uncharacterized protein LOC111695692 isoform X3 [Eurytemora affinis]
MLRRRSALADGRKRKQKGSVSGSRCGSVRTPDRLRGSSSQNSISEIWSNHEGSPVPREGEDSFPDVFQDGEEFVGSNRSRKNSILSRKGSVISRTGSAVSRKGSGMSRNGSHSSKIGSKTSSKRNSVRCVDSAETIPENGAGNRELDNVEKDPDINPRGKMEDGETGKCISCSVM